MLNASISILIGEFILLLRGYTIRPREEVVVAVQPSAEKVAADLRALTTRRGGACSEKELSACRALMSIAAQYRQRNAETRGDDLGTARKLLIDFTETHGNDDSDLALGKKGMNSANRIAVVGRAIRLYDGLPELIGARQEAAVKGTNIGVSIFKSRSQKSPNSIRQYTLTFAQSFLAYVDGLNSEHGKQGEPSRLRAAGIDEHASEAWLRLQEMSQRLATEIDRSAEADKQPRRLCRARSRRVDSAATPRHR
jgi:hypothetical protein